MRLELLVGIALWILAAGAMLQSGLEALGNFSRRDDPDGEHGAALVLGIFYTGLGLAGFILPFVIWLS